MPAKETAGTASTFFAHQVGIFYLRLNIVWIELTAKKYIPAVPRLKKYISDTLLGRGCHINLSPEHYVLKEKHFGHLWLDLQKHVQFVVTNKPFSMKFARSAEGRDSNPHIRRSCWPVKRVVFSIIICIHFVGNVL